MGCAINSIEIERNKLNTYTMDSIGALTVCVNYSDYLECIISNAHHFDEWLIVTSREDRDTQELCDRYQLGCVFSDRIYKSDGTFDAVFQKAAALNDGLERLQSKWAITIDSDILLPTNFRGYLDSLSLDVNCLYGLRGRRICSNVTQFSVLRDRENWLENDASPGSDIYGYFQMFSLNGPNTRYPEVPESEMESRMREPLKGCDVLFSDCFDSESRHKFSAVGLHLGPVEQNWKGRVSKQFTNGRTTDFSNACSELALNLSGNQREVLVLGPLEGELSRALRFRGFNVTQFDFDPRLDCFSVDQQKRINSLPSKRYDVLLLNFELDFFSLRRSLTAIACKLQFPFVACGFFFGRKDWNISTQAICLLLGAPDQVLPNSTWLRMVSIEEKKKHVFRDSVPALRGNFAICIVADDRDTVDGVAVFANSLRERWSGRIILVGVGASSPALEVIASIYCIEYYYTDSPAWESSVQIWADRNIIVSPTGVCIRDPQISFDLIELKNRTIQMAATRDGFMPIGFSKRWKGLKNWMEAPSVLRRFEYPGVKNLFYWFKGIEDNCHTWGSAYIAMMNDLCPEIYCGTERLQVYTWIDSDRFSVFNQNISRWRFRAQTRLKVFHNVTVTEPMQEELSIYDNVHTRFFYAQSIFETVLEHLLADLTLGPVVVLDSMLVPDVGAVLFPEDLVDHHSIAGSLSKDIFVPEIIRLGKMSIRDLTKASSSWDRFAMMLKENIFRIDPKMMGWRPNC